MIKERIIQMLEFKGIAKENFYKKIGVTSANFRGNAKKTPLNSTAIENILSEVSDLNLEWLITGNGSMLKSEVGGGVSQNIIGSGNVATGKGNITGNNNNSDAINYKEQIEQLQKKLQKSEAEVIRLQKQVDKLFNMIP